MRRHKYLHWETKESGLNSASQNNLEVVNIRVDMMVFDLRLKMESEEDKA